MAPETRKGTKSRPDSNALGASGDTPLDQTLPEGPVVTHEIRRAESRGKGTPGEAAAGGAETKATRVEGVVSDAITNSDDSKDDSLPRGGGAAPTKCFETRPLMLEGRQRTAHERWRRKGHDSKASSKTPGSSPPTTAGNGSDGMPKPRKTSTGGGNTKPPSAPRSFGRSCSSSKTSRRGGKPQGGGVLRRTIPRSQREGWSRARRPASTPSVTPNHLSPTGSSSCCGLTVSRCRSWFHKTGRPTP